MSLVNRENFFFLLFLFIPISIIAGSTVSLVNIVILNLFFLIFFIAQKKINFLSHISVKLIFVLYFYLIFNSFISQNYEIGFLRNFGFIRIVILFIFINYFFFYYEKEKKLLDIWSLILSTLVIDVYIEYFFGTNLFGWGSHEQIHGDRIMSFFKNEPIVGAYIAGFIFLIFGHLLKRFKKKTPAFVFLLLALTAIIFTGERSNTIKVFLGILIYFMFLDFLKIKIKIILMILFFTSFGLALSQSEYLKVRYVGQLYEVFTDEKNFKNFKEKNQYIRLYKSGYSVFKNYPIFGVGNKNYRVETCKDKGDQSKFDYVCLTHPHQLYFELLSEHGLFGFILILSIFFYLMFKILKSILLSRNYVQIGAFTFVLINFTPILPSGSFFSDFNITLFWLNFSVMYACNKKTNIFSKEYI